MTPIKIYKTKILLSKKYLGPEQAEVWISPTEEGTSDDNDERVLKDRQKAEQAYRTGQTKRPSGISVFTIKDSDDDGYYELETKTWSVGLYRFNYHSQKNEPTEFGSKLNPEKRDQEYSWAIFPEDVVNNIDVKPFIYQEPSKRGFCFRIKINEDHSIEPAGE